MGNLPAWLNAVVKVNPATYGVDAIRQFMLGPSMVEVGLLQLTVLGHTMSITDDVLVMLGFGVVTLAIAMWSFSKQD